MEENLLLDCFIDWERQNFFFWKFHSSILLGVLSFWMSRTFGSTCFFVGTTATGLLASVVSSESDESESHSWVLQLRNACGRSEYRHLSDSFNNESFTSGSKHLTTRRWVPDPQLREHWKCITNKFTDQCFHFIRFEYNLDLLLCLFVPLSIQSNATLDDSRKRLLIRTFQLLPVSSYFPHYSNPSTKCRPQFDRLWCKAPNETASDWNNRQSNHSMVQWTNHRRCIVLSPYMISLCLVSSECHIDRSLLNDRKISNGIEFLRHILLSTKSIGIEWIKNIKKKKNSKKLVKKIPVHSNRMKSMCLACGLPKHEPVCRWLSCQSVWLVVRDGDDDDDFCPFLCANDDDNRPPVVLGNCILGEHLVSFPDTPLHLHGLRCLNSTPERILCLWFDSHVRWAIHSCTHSIRRLSNRPDTVVCCNVESPHLILASFDGHIVCDCRISVNFPHEHNEWSVLVVHRRMFYCMSKSLLLSTNIGCAFSFVSPIQLPAAYPLPFQHCAPFHRQQVMQMKPKLD